MHSQSRSALVLGALPRPEQNNSSLPAHPDWQFVETYTIEAADALLTKNRDIRVGIWVYASGTSQEDDLTRFATLRARHRLVQWLALVPPSAIKDDAVASHVAQHFVDYLTTPVEHDRL